MTRHLTGAKARLVPDVVKLAMSRLGSLSRARRGYWRRAVAPVGVNYVERKKVLATPDHGNFLCDRIGVSPMR